MAAEMSRKQDEYVENLCHSHNNGYFGNSHIYVYSIFDFKDDEKLE